MVQLTAEDKLIKVRISLLREKPFFSFLALHLNMYPDKEIGTVGVDCKGNMPYNPEFIDSLTQSQCKGVLCHEVLHCALEHMVRLRSKQGELWNISTDAIVNTILQRDNFDLPQGGINPSGDEITLFGKRFDKLMDKSAEELYDSMYGYLKKKEMKNLEQFLKDSKTKGFDIHMENKEGDGKGDKKDGKEGGSGSCSCGDKEGEEKDWKKIFIDACTFARQRGNLPQGIERMLNELLKPEIDWKGYLYRYITSQIPVDYNWIRPSKKSISTGFYMPSVQKETIDVAVAIDTSGSIGIEELTSFLSEITGIIGAFSNVDLTVIDCDCEINSVRTYKHATITDIEQIKLKGGGGTSHIPVFDYVQKNMPQTKFLICFTDGYTSFPRAEDVRIQTLWVVAGDYRNDISKFPFGDIVSLPTSKD